MASVGGGSKKKSKPIGGVVPCSLCDAKFLNARDLGTHILTAHCEDGRQQAQVRNTFYLRML